METFYDGDLKDIWDSDLDPTDTLKLSTDTEMQDWFLERDVKIPTVILNDKLISDALFNGTLPIKSEHSYSLNSDGDSMPDSPRSLHTKMEDMDDDYYPAISLKSATCNTRRLHTATIDPNCLTIASTSSTTATPASASCSPVSVASLTANGSTLSATNPMLTATSSATLLSSGNGNIVSGSNSHSSLGSNNSNSSSSIYAGLNRMASAPMTFNLRTLTTTSGSIGNSSSSSSSSNNNCNNNNTISKQLQIQLQLQQQQQMLLQQQQQQQQRHELNGFSTLAGTACTSPATTRDGSISPDICSDIEIDESCIKDEPMSPSSSCPPSPNNSNNNNASNSNGGTGGNNNNAALSLNMANVAAFTNSDLVFEHKNGSLQLTPASQSLLKSQQFILSSNNNNNVQSIVIPKVSIKTESLSNGNNQSGSLTLVPGNGAAGGSAFGLPPTPPSSMPSDDSEGNQSPEHLSLSPHSPSTSITNNQTVSASALAGNNNQHHHCNGTNSNSAAAGNTIISASATSARRSTSSSSSSSSSHSNSPASLHTSHTGRNFSGSSTRQPIHTPLISSQPKGSTGTLVLTEEEKRTLLAEGYPIPQRLPLTKAEEKSLKKIRRKIKNKISAQESRRKKKEYMDQLERKVEGLVNENIDYKKRVDSLEDANASLLSQLQKLQALVNKQNKKA